MYANIDGFEKPDVKTFLKNVSTNTNLTNLDKWILSELELAQTEITKSMDNYQLA
jgi:isoleucyl-tRNA synthetase